MKGKYSKDPERLKIYRDATLSSAEAAYILDVDPNSVRHWRRKHGMKVEDGRGRPKKYTGTEWREAAEAKRARERNMRGLESDVRESGKINLTYGEYSSGIRRRREYPKPEGYPIFTVKIK